MADELVRVEGLQKHFEDAYGVFDRLLGEEKSAVRAVDGIDFSIRQGETLGLVGESGCGKSTTGELLLALQEPTDGSVRLDETDIYGLSGEEELQFRRQAQMVFQNASSSLNPRMTIRAILREPLDYHGIGSEETREEQVVDLVERVGLSVDHLDRYPHEFSGGQQQRIGIARALALDPEFMVLDEPVSALDVSIQAQILNLLERLQDEFDLTYLFIAHDLGVVRYICDRIAVMYLGKIVEIGETERIFRNPQHPYTQGLLESVPRPDVDERERDIEPLEGEVPSPRDPPSGCRFHPRCPYAREVCEDNETFERFVDQGVKTACYRIDEDHEYWSSDPISKEQKATQVSD